MIFKILFFNIIEKKFFIPRWKKILQLGIDFSFETKKFIYQIFLVFYSNVSLLTIIWIFFYIKKLFKQKSLLYYIFLLIKSN